MWVIDQECLQQVDTTSRGVFTILNAAHFGNDISNGEDVKVDTLVEIRKCPKHSLSQPLGMPKTRRRLKKLRKQERNRRIAPTQSLLTLKRLDATLIQTEARSDTGFSAEIYDTVVTLGDSSNAVRKL
ncbi:uncharacterized protein MYCGRDRAFT_97847 [Zymoseptoria tritici IPO323]|uniref:Uncharacterized protein n=1 Tax=Zymoseptoria tritici (strain CBS 115943 / IPO323) TaxID=336722 RepID=F9XRK1_ZYMTI|nr:uncharacterized protein MYCGRDRAFT_97847 [Zymoseptoria tritici IPO323]EGP82149.1 hypothetical protein MYCGRDRAFT_97847 [Zymoseptoria tritici IPO323]